jgi:hypothetical protein
MTGRTLEDQPRYLQGTFGRYSFPNFTKVYDPASGGLKPNGKINYFEEVYYIPYSPAQVKKILAKDQTNTNTGMSIKVGDTLSYVVTNKEDFINLPANKLISKITGKEIDMISAPQRQTNRHTSGIPREDIRNTQLEQEEARRKMYDIELASGFGPTEEQKAEAQPTLVPQPVLNVQPSLTPSMPQSQQEKEEGEKQAEVTSTATGKAGQSRAKERIGENVGVVLKHEDTGVKENMTKDSITIEEPQGQSAKDQMEKDRAEEDRRKKERK